MGSHAPEWEPGNLLQLPLYPEVIINGLLVGSSLQEFLSDVLRDLHKGFARIYCDACGHDYLLAFSCKTRYFCPSCHQKRMLAYGNWVEEDVLAARTSPAIRFYRSETPAALLPPTLQGLRDGFRASIATNTGMRCDAVASLHSC